MEAKLIKVDNGWVLMVNNIMYATDENAPYPRLSVKNCQAIELGYDLDELSKEYMKISSIEFDAFKSGFQKALEILGDKKFSSRNILKSFTTGVFTDENSDYDFEFTELMKDLQQTEWDVDIVTTTIMENGKSGLDVPIIKPKLDAENCLILKRK